MQQQPFMAQQQQQQERTELGVCQSMQVDDTLPTQVKAAAQVTAAAQKAIAAQEAIAAQFDTSSDTRRLESPIYVPLQVPSLSPHCSSNCHSSNASPPLPPTPPSPTSVMPPLLPRSFVWSFGTGHFLNDITAAAWFTYLLIFLTDIGLTQQ